MSNTGALRYHLYSHPETRSRHQRTQASTRVFEAFSCRFFCQHAAVTKRLTRDGKPVPMQIQKNMLRKSVQSSCNKTRTSSNPCIQEAVFERSGPAVFIKASALDVQLVQFKALLPDGRCVEQAATTSLALRGVASHKLHPLFLSFVVVEVGLNPRAAST